MMQCRADQGPGANLLSQAPVMGHANYTHNYTALHYTALHFTELNFTALHYIQVQSTHLCYGQAKSKLNQPWSDNITSELVCLIKRPKRRTFLPKREVLN